jgi:uroporphyrinogen-III synthase
MNQIKILSTRKLDPALHTRALIEDILLVEENLIRTHFKKDPDTVEKIITALNSGISNLVFTSSNAVKAFELILKQEGLKLQGKIIYCLSGKTKDAVQKAFIDVPMHAEARNAEELARVVVKEGVEEVVFICGNKRRDSLPEILTKEGVQWTEIIVYDTEEAPKKMDEDFDAVVFFSPSAVSSFFRYNQLSEDTVCFAIGETTAESLREMKIENIVTSPYPQEEKIFETLINFFKK